MTAPSQSLHSLVLSRSFFQWVDGVQKSTSRKWCLFAIKL